MGLSFWSPERRWRCWDRLQPGLPRDRGGHSRIRAPAPSAPSLADTSLWDLTAGEGRGRGERLLPQPSLLAVRIPAHTPHARAGRSQGYAKVGDEAVVRALALWRQRDLGLNPQTFLYCASL